MFGLIAFRARGNLLTENGIFNSNDREMYYRNRTLM